MAKMLTVLRFVLAAWVAVAATAPARADAPLLKSAKSGAWSAPATWEGGKVPGAGARVQIAPGHTVVYDVKSEQAIRFIHVGGILRFAYDKDTRLDVGLIKIQPGNDASEHGFDCLAPLIREQVPVSLAHGFRAMSHPFVDDSLIDASCCQV